MRILAGSSTLVIVVFYLVAQMVGAGKLIQLLFGLPYAAAIGVVGTLMILYVTFGGMLATTWAQLIKAVLLLSGTVMIAFGILRHFGFSFEAHVPRSGATARAARGHRCARRAGARPGFRHCRSGSP